MRWRSMWPWAAAPIPCYTCWRSRAKTSLDYPVAHFNVVSDRTPHLAKVSPAWDGPQQWHIQDVHAAGGVPAILAELARCPGVLKLDALTVRPAETMGETWPTPSAAATPAYARSTTRTRRGAH